jgi:3-oxoacyl-[acyl-carrier protein] reductase
MRFEDRVCVITGAAGGIGKAVTQRFSDEGAAVVLADVDLSGSSTMAEKLKKAGRKVLTATVDVSDQVAVEQLLKDVVTEFGTIDILVNSAGIRKDNPVQKTTLAEWNAIVQTNLTGSFICARTAQKYMASQLRGKIINISCPFPAALSSNGVTGYTAANLGIEGLTKALAVELGRFNINVNCVAPDFIDTGMMRSAARKSGMYLDDFREFSVAQVPLRRLGTPGDVANVVLFLASDESSYVNGQVICVKGGP